MYFFEVHNFEDKRSLVDIDQLPNMSFQFFIEWTQFFLFIGPESDHCLPLSLTHSCLVNLISVTLACGDGNSKLVEVVTVVKVGDERHVDNSLVQVWKINFGHKVKFFRILRTRFQGLFKILKLMFRQDFEVVSQV